MSAAALHMDEGALVDEAVRWSELIVRVEHRGYGDSIDAATYRAARQTKVPEKVFRALRFPYRRPKTIAAGVYLKLCAVGQRIEAALQREMQLAEAAGLDEHNSPAYRAAKAALRKGAP